MNARLQNAVCRAATAAATTTTYPEKEGVATLRKLLMAKVADVEGWDTEPCIIALSLIVVGILYSAYVRPYISCIDLKGTCSFEQFAFSSKNCDSLHGFNKKPSCC